jgi:hypothetical protein
MSNGFFSEGFWGFHLAYSVQRTGEEKLTTNLHEITRIFFNHRWTRINVGFTQMDLL